MLDRIFNPSRLDMNLEHSYNQGCREVSGGHYCMGLVSWCNIWPEWTVALYDRHRKAIHQRITAVSHYTGPVSALA